MTDLYLPGAEKHLVGNEGAMEGGPARATWHITSNANDHTFHNELGWFTGGGAGVAPHLLWDPFTGQIAQFFPADSRSLSLQNAGDVRTNRTGKYNIQIEIIFTSGEVVNARRTARWRRLLGRIWESSLPGFVLWASLTLGLVALLLLLPETR